MTVVTIIPARYGSSRLPGKPLADICGKPMIQRVVEIAKKTRCVDRVLVATDDSRIFSAVESFGGEAKMTSSDFKSGSDRIAAVAHEIDADIIVNLQGDEPMMAPEDIESAVEMVRSGGFPMATLMASLEPSEARNPNIVKVLVEGNRAVKFSRNDLGPLAGRHIGLYVFSRECLFRMTTLPQTESEKTERLEQLRAMENGIEIGVRMNQYPSIGVDTPEDLFRVREALK